MTTEGAIKAGIARIQELESINADLLEALEVAKSFINRHVVAMDAEPVLKIAEAAIARARGQ